MLSTVVTVCFIACHGGAANHFAVYANELASKGYCVEIYATGPALKVFQRDNIERLHEFSLTEGSSEKEVAAEIAIKCQRAAAVITDVGHVFDIALHNAFISRAPKVKRMAYYDNPESYVPGGYSQIASQVMQRTHKVLFANAKLAKTSIYERPSIEVPLSQDSKIGLGYYPLRQAEEIAQRRGNEHHPLRARFFSRYDIADKGQKIFVYIGGNNETYFSQALPACFHMIGDLSTQRDLSDIVLILQQHPGAKTKNRDAYFLEKWLKQYGNRTYIPKVLISDMSMEDALVVADTILYYQTSLGAQCVFAGIPIVQMGHTCYEDVLVKNNLCLVVNSTEEFVAALDTLQNNGSEVSSEVIERGLGIRSNWSDRIERVIDCPLPHGSDMIHQNAIHNRLSLRQKRESPSALSVGVCQILH